MMTTKGVTFNLGKEDQVKLYQHGMKQKNFSGYVKRLIEADMNKRTVKSPPNSGGIKFNL
jgi:hypothetical protein